MPRTLDDLQTVAIKFDRHSRDPQVDEQIRQSIRAAFEAGRKAQDIERVLLDCYVPQSVWLDWMPTEEEIAEQERRREEARGREAVQWRRDARGRVRWSAG